MPSKRIFSNLVELLQVNDKGEIIWHSFSQSYYMTTDTISYNPAGLVKDIANKISQARVNSMARYTASIVVIGDVGSQSIDNETEQEIAYQFGCLEDEIQINFCHQGESVFDESESRLHQIFPDDEFHSIMVFVIPIIENRLN